MQESDRQENTKLISYVGAAINTLIIAQLLHIGQVINSTALTTAKFEENIKALSKQHEIVELKLDNIISESRQTDKKIAQLEVRVNNHEKEP
jgi:septal ring factor EnvC (AmiA/AmiB activator)